MKFRNSSQLPPHQDRRLQLRMLGYVGLIAAGLIGWQLWRSSERPGDPLRIPQPSLDEVEFNVTDESSGGLKEDEFRIAPRRRASAPREDEPKVEREPATSIPSEWLANVHDNTLGIRHDEAEAYYRILAKAESLPEGDLERAADREALFVNLMTTPERYRGRPVAIIGELRKLRRIAVPRTDSAPATLYEAWICTADGGENPYRVVCSEIPPQLTPAEQLRVDVMTAGYFFKREGYETQDRRLHVAPTILAGRLSLYVSPLAPAPVDDMVPWTAGVVTVIGLAMLATVIGYALSDSRVRRRRDLSAAGAIEVEALARADRRISIEESLRRLEESDSLDETADESLSRGNGVHSVGDASGEVIDLPTPLPPTRVPRRDRPA